MGLGGKRVVVLGGTSGIGLAIAEGVALLDGEPVVVSKRLKSVAIALACLPDRASGHAVDLTNEVAVAELFEKVGLFDHLAYTAANTLVSGPLADMDLTAARNFLNARFWERLPPRNTPSVIFVQEAR